MSQGCSDPSACSDGTTRSIELPNLVHSISNSQKSSLAACHGAVVTQVHAAMALLGTSSCQIFSSNSQKSGKPSLAACHGAIVTQVHAGTALLGASSCQI